MNILIIAQQPRKFLSNAMYDGIIKAATAAGGSCDVRYLNRDETLNLKKYFARNVNLANYDRIVLAIRLKRAFTQVKFIRSLPHLAFHETDAFQNYTDCKYRGEFSRYYQTLPWARIVSTGYGVSQRLRAEGFDAVFVPKGYDQHLCRNLQRARPIELGFVGSTNNAIYVDRKALLEQLLAAVPIEVCQTKPGSDYVDKLNDIRIFVSADAGMGEYMIKNFEAMACGCLLFAYDQGNEENAAVGFRDMENVVLYRTIDEFQNKLKILRADPALLQRIASTGQRFAEENCNFDSIGMRIVAALQAPLREKAGSFSWRERLRNWLR